MAVQAEMVKLLDKTDEMEGGPGSGPRPGQGRGGRATGKVGSGAYDLHPPTELGKSHPTGGVHAGNYRGHDLYFTGSSYNAPSVKEWGHGNDLSAMRAIDKHISKRQLTTENEGEMEGGPGSGPRPGQPHPHAGTGGVSDITKKHGFLPKRRTDQGQISTHVYEHPETGEQIRHMVGRSPHGGGTSYDHWEHMKPDPQHPGQKGYYVYVGKNQGAGSLADHLANPASKMAEGGPGSGPRPGAAALAGSAAASHVIAGRHSAAKDLADQHSGTYGKPGEARQWTEHPEFRKAYNAKMNKNASARARHAAYTDAGMKKTPYGYEAVEALASEDEETWTPESRAAALAARRAKADPRGEQTYHPRKGSPPQRLYPGPRFEPHQTPYSQLRNKGIMGERKPGPSVPGTVSHRTSPGEKFWQSADEVADTSPGERGPSRNVAPHPMSLEAIYVEATRITKLIEVGWTPESRAAALAARQAKMGGHPAQRGPHQGAGADSPIYTDRQKMRGYNVNISPLAADYRTSGRMLRQRFPDMQKNDHVTVGDKFSNASRQMDQDYQQAVGVAKRNLKGDPGPLISGIVSDKFDDATKDNLRRLAHGSSSAGSAAMAHYAASGLGPDTARYRLRGEYKGKPGTASEGEAASLPASAPLARKGVQARLSEMTPLDDTSGSSPFSGISRDSEMTPLDDTSGSSPFSGISRDSEEDVPMAAFKDDLERKLALRSVMGKPDNEEKPPAEKKEGWYDDDGENQSCYDEFGNDVTSDEYYDGDCYDENGNIIDDNSSDSYYLSEQDIATDDERDEAGMYSKEEVNYRYAPQPEVKSCGNCMYYDDGACELVAGLIRPIDLCDLWEEDENETGDEGVVQSVLSEVGWTDESRAAARAARMSKGHFRQIAHIVRHDIPEEHRTVVANHLGDSLSGTNPNFDRNKFIKASSGTGPFNPAQGDISASQIKTPKMIRSQYVHIADAINALPADMRGPAAQAFARGLRGTNPNYDQGKFLARATRGGDVGPTHPAVQGGHSSGAASMRQR